MEGSPLAVAAAVEEGEFRGAKVDDVEAGMVLAVPAEAEGLMGTADLTRGLDLAHYAGARDLLDGSAGVAHCR